MTAVVRPARLLPSLLAGLLMAGLLSVVPAALPAQAAPAPGANGIGDPYFPRDGNGGIDVVHYDVRDRYAFDSRRLSGTTRLTVRATRDLSRFNLDFLLPVSSVKVDGRKARFRKPSAHELQITPTRSIRAGARFTVLVRYAGLPGTKRYLGERNWLASPTEVVAMNEPHMAPWWFPSNDHPLDKATFDVRINAPRDKQVVSNGRRIGRTVVGKRAVTHWRATEPMATYLAFFAAGRFAVRRGVDHGLPWYVAVSRGLGAAKVRTQLANISRTPAIVRWLAGQVGPYPFNATGGLITDLDVNFALENQTRPTYPRGVNPSLLVHELAHQWFGDSVSVHHWRDIWLNEGFATFMEVRYAETHGGATGAAWLDSYYDYYQDEPDFWELKVGAPGARRIFDGAVYTRGAMTLQALRNRIGTADLFTVLRTWTHDRRFGNGSIEDFETLAEQVSGKDLDGFFQAWLFSGRVPARTADNGLA